MRRHLRASGPPADALGRGSQLQRQQVVPHHPPFAAPDPDGKGRVRLLRHVLLAVRALRAGLGRLAGFRARAARTHPRMERAAWLVAPLLKPPLATAPSVLAANAFYLHDPLGTYTMDNQPSSNGTPAHFQMDTPGATQAWATTVAYTGQTIPAGSYTFTYWVSGEGSASVTAALIFGYSATSSCTVIVPITAWTAALVNGSGSSTSTSTPAVVLPANSYLCWQITVVSVSKGGLDLRYDGNNQQTSIATPSIVVPEHATPLIGLALLLPLAAPWLIRRPKRRLAVRVR